MKFYSCTILLLAGVFTSTFAQHSGFQTLKNKFEGRKDVWSISTSGFLARTVLWMTGEYDFKQSIRHIDNIRLITIPRTAYRDQNVTVKGFKKILVRDSYEELAAIKDHGNDVTLYIQPNNKKRDNRYLLLIEELSEVIAIEIEGYIDPEVLLRKNEFTSSNKE